MSAVMAKAYKSHLRRVSSENSIQGLQNQQQLLLFRVTHAINQQQELSAPMVISYIMGWGDSVRSHHYSPIYWSTFLRALFKSDPSLGQGSVVNGQDNLENTSINQVETENDVTNASFHQPSIIYFKWHLTQILFTGPFHLSRTQ